MAFLDFDGLSSFKTKLDTQFNSKITLDEENIPGTTQIITFDAEGNVSQIVHNTTGTSTAVRTDVFTFGTNTITEVRTLNTGESLTIVTNLTTLETTVTYSAA